MNLVLDFNSDMNIVVGKNGSGKTTVLKLLWYATSGNIERLVRELVFDSVYVRTDTFWIRITRESGTKGSPTTERGKAMRD